ncbi:MAG: tRNA (N6-isopentenyl adenosine(37)-C2)-methylthiotransferase MiaB [Acidobacteriota bacterium]
MKRYHIETWGCQMNVLDSQYLEGVLQARGLVATDDPARADVVLLNTCAVREKAVQKVRSRLGELRALRAAGGLPTVVGLCGCVAEQEGSRLLEGSSVLSFVLGPGRLGHLPHALDAVADGGKPALTGFTAGRDVDAHLVFRGSAARQYVTAIHGCNQHCTFCVVPYTRGHEASRPLAAIVSEVRELAGRGVVEVTLLGQTVNAYRCPDTGTDFAGLLEAVSDGAAPQRLQFLTSHPNFFTDRLLGALSRIPAVGSYLHVPFQSGSDSVLKRMHRGYTRSDYLGMVHRLREARPDISLSTDVIVGFPGETEADFLETLEVVEEVRFGQLFGFAFSPRPKTSAAKYSGRVGREEMGDRLERLFEIQGAIQLELNQSRIGREVRVLIDGPAKRGELLWQGRGDDNRVVNFPGWSGIEAGQTVAVTITGATAHSLLGERVIDGAQSGPTGA